MQLMGFFGQRALALLMMTLIVLSLVILPVLAADQEINRLLRSPIGKDWVTNGGNLTNQRYSTLKQIDTSNVMQLKGAWMTRLKGSGFSAKYSLEASPLVKNGVMYVITGNNDVFALDAKTGAILWEYWSDIDKKISALCCGWVNRDLAIRHRSCDARWGDRMEHARPRSGPRASLLRDGQLWTES